MSLVHSARDVGMFRYTRPSRLRIEASSACNLRCPACPTTTGHISPAIGTGLLAHEDFQQLLDDNPWIDEVELSNYGEVFLNPDLVEILRTAYERKVRITLMNGVNLNRCTAEALEAIVKYDVQGMTCSIDGASQESYRRYRVNGDFDRVMANIDVINAHKKRLGKSTPILWWQFIVMGHNEQEIDKARRMAAERGMHFRAKLTWDDDFSPLRNFETLRKALGHAPTRDSWGKEQGKIYAEDTCLQLWMKPQINWDGKLLGCCFNFWGDFGGNAFEQGLERVLDSEKLADARRLLQGHAPTPPDTSIPCASCSIYHQRRKWGRWIGRRRLMGERLRQMRGLNSLRRTRLWRSVVRPILRSLRRCL